MWHERTAGLALDAREGGASCEALGYTDQTGGPRYLGKLTSHVREVLAKLGINDYRT